MKITFILIGVLFATAAFLLAQALSPNKGADLSASPSRPRSDDVVDKLDGSVRSSNGPIAKQLHGACDDTLDFIQVPGYPNAIRVFALTHSRRNVVQR
jgi:hypothetical protein